MDGTTYTDADTAQEVSVKGNDTLCKLPMCLLADKLVLSLNETCYILFKKP